MFILWQQFIHLNVLLRLLRDILLGSTGQVIRKIRIITGFLGKILVIRIMRADQILENSKTLAGLSWLKNGGDSELLNTFGLIS